MGVMLKIDQVTSLQAIGQFARICVELDLSKPLESKVVARGHILQLEFEGLHTICFNCGLYGHMVSECPSLNKPEVMIDAVEKNPAAERKDVQPQESGEVAATALPANNGRADVSPDQISNPQPINQHTIDSGIVGEGKSEDNDYGPWMLVQRPKRKQKPKGNGNKSVPGSKSGAIIINSSDDSSGPSNNKDSHADKNKKHVSHAMKSGTTYPPAVFSSIGGPSIKNSLGGKNPQRKHVGQGISGKAGKTTGVKPTQQSLQNRKLKVKGKEVIPESSKPKPTVSKPRIARKTEPCSRQCATSKKKTQIWVCLI